MEESVWGNGPPSASTPGEYEFRGQVTAIYPQAQIRDNVVDYLTVIRFTPPQDRILRPEMTTTVKVALDEHQNVLTVPIRAVRHEGARQFVMVRKGNQFDRQPITTGLRDDSYWEIIGGLHEGDEVLVGELNKQ